MMCFHKGPVVLRYALVMWTLYFYFSHFFTSFFIGLRRICLRAKVGNLVFIICSLLEGPDGVTDKLTATFSPMKKTLSRPQVQSLERWKSHFRALNFQNFLRQNAPRPLPAPPLKKGTNCPLLIQSVTLFKPTAYFNFFWNPCIWYRCRDLNLDHIGGRRVLSPLRHPLLPEITPNWWQPPSQFRFIC